MNMTPAFSTTETPSHGNARAAVQQTLPLFEMMRMRAATTARRHPVQGFASDNRASHMRWMNHFTHTHRRIGPEDREVVSPNNDTVFSNAWLDLSRGPVLIDTPDMGERYWTLGLLDAWTNPFAYVGRRTTGNRRQRTLVHGPAWHGPVPDGVDNVIAAPGEDVWVIGRLLVDDRPDDLEQAAALQRGISTHRLDGGEAAFRVDTGLDGRAGHAPDAALYRATIDEALARNPVPTGRACVVQWMRELLRTHCHWCTRSFARRPSRTLSGVAGRCPSRCERTGAQTWRCARASRATSSVHWASRRPCTQRRRWTPMARCSTGRTPMSCTSSQAQCRRWTPSGRSRCTGEATACWWPTQRTAIRLAIACLVC